MRQTKFTPGYGYVTYGSGFWQDAGIELSKNIGKRVASAVGDVIGRKLANKIVAPKTAKVTKDDVIRQIESMPEPKPEPNVGLPEDVRKALYGSGAKIKKKTKNILI